MEYGRAAKSIAKTQGLGVDRVSAATYSHRLITCQLCPKYNGQFWAGPRCMECGCLVRLKADDAEESCPLGKW